MFQGNRKIAHNLKADLIVFPELFATRFTFVSKEEALSLAEIPEGDKI